MAADTVWVGIRQTGSTATILALITALAAIGASILAAIFSLGREKRMLRVRLRYDACRAVSRQLDKTQAAVGAINTLVATIGPGWMPSQSPAKHAARGEARADVIPGLASTYYQEEESLSFARFKIELLMEHGGISKTFLPQEFLLADMRPAITALNESFLGLNTALDDLEAALREFADGKASHEKVMARRHKALTVLSRYDMHLFQFAWALQQLAVGDVTKHQKPLDLFTTDDPEELVLTRDGFVAAKRTEFFNPSKKSHG